MMNLPKRLRTQPEYWRSGEREKIMREAANEIEWLKADIERHVKLVTDQQQELERLRAVNRRAKALADEHALEIVRLRAALGRIIEIDGLPDDPGPCGHIAIAALSHEQTAKSADDGLCPTCGTILP